MAAWALAGRARHMMNTAHRCALNPEAEQLISPQVFRSEHLARAHITPGVLRQYLDYHTSASRSHGGRRQCLHPARSANLLVCIYAGRDCFIIDDFWNTTIRHTYLILVVVCHKFFSPSLALRPWQRQATEDVYGFYFLKGWSDEDDKMSCIRFSIRRLRHGDCEAEGGGILRGRGEKISVQSWLRIVSLVNDVLRISSLMHGIKEW